MRYLEPNSEAYLKMGEVHWLYTMNDPPADWGPVEGTLPRVRMVTKVKASRNVRDDSKNIDVSNTVLLPVDTLPPFLQLPPGVPGKATIKLDYPGYIQVEASAKTTQLLFLSESYHKGWKAYANGAELMVVPAFGDFLSCLVYPGNYTITFVFEPRSLAIGKNITYAGIVAVLLLFSIVWLATAGQKSAPRN
jgi:hypothetical protein